MTKYIYKLSPFLKETIWGWEKWVVSCHPNGPSIVDNGDLKGEALKDVEKFKEVFPILVKIIKADSVLSVQVHPDDEYARIHENSKGKTECWYILEAEKGATLISGIKKGLNKEKLRQIINDGKLEEELEETEVKPGDLIYIPSGTVHAIKGGLKLIEVQQNSDITYRLYDWGRGREEHVEQSLNVIDYTGENKGGKIENFSSLETPYFKVNKIEVKDTYKDSSKDGFNCFVVIDGEGTISCDENSLKISKEETVYIPQGINYEIKGSLTLIKSNE